MTATAYPHILSDRDGTLFVGQTRIKLPILIASHTANQWDAEQLLAQFPDLTRAEIHSALAFYYDHKDVVDEDITRRAREADTWFTAQPPSPAELKLRAHKPSRAE
jgi:uncharacterized protein (DUF433 family)